MSKQNFIKPSTHPGWVKRKIPSIFKGGVRPVCRQAGVGFVLIIIN